jgi:hypothetical protein
MRKGSKKDSKKGAGASKPTSTHSTRQSAREELIETWQERFIAALRNSGNVRAACQAAGVHRTTPYKAYAESPEFARQWDEALEDAVDTLEAAAWKRARDGVTRHDPIMFQGQKVAEKVITEYSDTLMITLLKAHRPEKYRERVDMKHSGKVGFENLKQAVLEAMAQHRKDFPGIAEAERLDWFAQDSGIDKTELVSEANN